jgi:transcriptional regulator with XRE-family HTH domain
LLTDLLGFCKFSEVCEQVHGLEDCRCVETSQGDGFNGQEKFDPGRPTFPLKKRGSTMSLAQRVRDYRYSKGWGPDELASRAAISRTALYQIESGKTELPRAGTLRRIALALEVPMESLLGHGEAGKSAQGAHPGAASSRKARTQSGWIPGEGGPLTVPSSRQGPTFGTNDDSRFAVEAQDLAGSYVEVPVSSREHELARKLHELLASPLGEGVALIVEESYRLLPQMRSSS